MIRMRDRKAYMWVKSSEKTLEGEKERKKGRKKERRR